MTPQAVAIIRDASPMDARASLHVTCVLGVALAVITLLGAGCRAGECPAAPCTSRPR